MRQQLSTTLALVLLATGSGAVAHAESPGAAAPGATHRLQSASIDLAALRDTAGSRANVFLTPQLQSARYSMVAVSWHGRSPGTVEVRTRTEGAWSPWRELHALDAHAPDPGTAEQRRSARRTGTELIWVGPSTGVQARLQGDHVEPSPSTRVVLVDPGRLPTDTTTEPPGSTATLAGVGDAPQPRIRSRRAWGANESWRNGGPYYNARLKQAHIHHTAASNRYSRADVPAIIRGDYWYHTHQLGWSDLGYNFVVDKFGRIWEGRAGGIARNVRGAHTLGFNHASFGVAAIGNLQNVRPTSALVTALVRLTAWKLDMHDRRPDGHAWVTSEGSDRYPEGTRVRLPTIDGHRDTNQTACPGDHLYAKLPEIRRRAQRRADAVYPAG